MKVVLDTNVFISGIFFSGSPFEILEAWKDGKVQLVISPEIMDEYQRVGEILAGEHPAINLKPLFEYITHNALVYSAPPLPSRVSEDADDDKFLACALAGDSHLIVSGDKHLLKISGYRDIEVLKPRDFLLKYLGS